MDRLNLSTSLSMSEALAAKAALKQDRCFPCGSACKPAAFGTFKHPSTAKSMVYPLCRTCWADAADAKQSQAFAEAIERRFGKLGEVKP